MDETQGLRILVVEDQESWRESVKRHAEWALKQVGRPGTVHVAGNSHDAVTALEEGKPWHLVITDIQLDASDARDRTGMDVVMKSSLDKVPCIVVSATLTPQDVDNILRQFKVRRFFGTPYNLSDFNAEVKDILFEALGYPSAASRPPVTSPEAPPAAPSKLGTMSVEPIFRGRNLAVKDKMIFVIMPFSEPWSEDVWQDMITPICEELGMMPLRGDKQHGRIITEDIWRGICEARIVIADITDRNPNVFYELGIAHTVGKECILLTQQDEIPFDLKSYRYIKYHNNISGYKKLREELQRFIKAILNESD